MPTISMFCGIVIYMFFYDDKKHHLPHFSHPEVRFVSTSRTMIASSPFKTSNLLKEKALISQGLLYRIRLRWVIN